MQQHSSWKSLSSSINSSKPSDFAMFSIVTPKNMQLPGCKLFHKNRGTPKQGRLQNQSPELARHEAYRHWWHFSILSISTQRWSPQSIASSKSFRPASDQFPHARNKTVRDSRWSNQLPTGLSTPLANSDSRSSQFEQTYKLQSPVPQLNTLITRVPSVLGSSLSFS